MKKNIILSTVLFLLTLMAVAQDNKVEFVNVILKNNSFLPKNVTVISYAPNETGNGTQGYWLLPGGTKQLKFKVGTKLYLANRKQVGTVMSGKRIDTDEPFLTVTKEDNNQTFKF